MRRRLRWRACSKPPKESRGPPSGRWTTSMILLRPKLIRLPTGSRSTAAGTWSCTGPPKSSLGWIALNGRRNAALNPLAVYRDPMTMDDYLGARLVSTPFGLLDCDVPIDGSIAVVVSHADYAGDCPHRAVRVEAVGGSDGSGGWFHRPDYPKMAMSDATAQMWSRTELTPADIAVAELYDGFTFLTLAWLEALGVCGDGEAGPFVQGARGSRATGDCRSTPTAVSSRPVGCTATGRCTRDVCSYAAKPVSVRLSGGPRWVWSRWAVGPSPGACCSPAERGVRRSVRTSAHR